MSGIMRPFPVIRGIVMLCFLSVLCCGGEGDIDISLGTDGNPSLNDIVQKGDLPLSQTGYMVYDMDSKRVVISHNRSKQFIPCSITKIPTTVAALHVLGHDYRFITSLHSDGKIKDGVLTGDLFLKGTGDPLFTVTNLLDFAESMEKAGIRKVEGRFCYDESELSGTERIDPLMAPDGSYNTGVSALSLEFNCIHAVWKTDEDTDEEKHFLIPDLPAYRFIIAPGMKKKSTQFRYRNEEGVQEWTLVSTYKKNERKRIPVKTPALYTAQVFRKLCDMRGITLPAPVAGSVNRGSDEIYVHKSAPLLRLVETNLLYSNNLMSELILLTAAKKITGNSMTIEEAGDVVAGFFRKKIRSVDWKGFIVKNGSGLTGSNRVSPEQMMAILLAAESRKFGGKSYMSLLPISGWKGTLARRLDGPDTAFRVYAKTGTINYAIAIAGYMLTRSKKKMAFVLFLSDIERRKLVDSDSESREKNAAQREAWNWIKDNRKSVDHVIEQWIDRI